MPEGDTIYKIAAALRPELEGERVVSLRLRNEPGEGAAPGVITTVQARGKHLLLSFDDGRVLRSHLGMHGDWHRYSPGEPWRKPERRASIVLETARAVYVCFNAKEWQWLREDGWGRRQFENRLRHDILAQQFDIDAVIARARRYLEPETPLVDVLLDQRVAAGIGNVYKSELLFLARLEPTRTLQRTDDEQLRELYVCARRLLQANTGGGPRVTRPVNDGQGRLWVYGREGKACLQCGAAVRRAKSGQHLRSTYWCPNCQGGGQSGAADAGSG